MYYFHRLICGVSRPDEVLECIERGVDLFESFFPYQVTERGCALTFSFDYQPNPEETCRSFEVNLNVTLKFYFLSAFGLSHKPEICAYCKASLL